ncbi:DUF3160 domain-containing protein [candidate division KSB1 bacterium]|nr:DUF3160 domain-containing protein [candidate division KSB1 bacterium]
MKKKIVNGWLIVAMICLVFPAKAKSQMIADITDPVATDFGIYSPNPVTITPSVLAYTVQPDFSNVINFDEFNFNEIEKQFLMQNYFLVSPKRISDWGTGYKELFDVYNECREQGIPVFVTTDAMLHTFHLCFDRILMDIEQKRFYKDLHNLLTALLDHALYQQYSAITDERTKIAMLRTIDYLITARVLLDSTYVPPVNGGNYIQELALVRAHADFEFSPIMEYLEDYTQYIVRGHYTKTDTLRQYFRSMMYLGRMTFAADPDPSFEALNRETTLSALLLLQALKQVNVKGESPMLVWDRIYSPTVFLVGKSDDISPQQYFDLALQVYGDNFAAMDINSIGDSPEFDEFLAFAKSLPGPRITYPGQPQGFRFMGQRFVPDSYILDELVMTKIPGRTMPTGLDVMTVLGSERARQHLQDRGDMANPYYAAKLDSLCTEFRRYPEETWAQNLYWNWLYSLMPMLFTKQQGYPSFMLVPAWVDKELLAALGSWAELRHDTILYVKQSGTETSMPPASKLHQGYVEPNPHLYGRLASLARFFIDGLDDRGLLFSNFKINLEHFENLALSLKTISEKELLRESLTPAEYDLICNFGLEIELIAEFNEWGMTEGPGPGSECEMPVIADVHTDATSGLCLEEGVGYPFVIYVIAPVEGQLKITKGAGFSYYEFTQPIANRLTDEAWRTMLKQGTAPDLPQWCSSFIDSDWQNSKPEYYFMSNMGFQGFYAEIETESPTVGDNILLRLRTTEMFGENTPVVMVEKPDGSSVKLSALSRSGNDFVDTVKTADWESGQVWIDATAEITRWEMEQPTVQTYRTGFFLRNLTGIDPEIDMRLNGFRLEQNYPNPFNPETRIEYHLPETAFITLKIYNILGKEMRTLVAGRQAAGNFYATWNGKDALGLDAPSGVYIARLIAGTHVESRKLILMR